MSFLGLGVIMGWGDHVFILTVFQTECPSVTCILCIFCGSEHTTGSWGHQGMFLSLSFSICVEGNTGIHVCDRQGRSGNRGHGVGTV